MLKQYGTRALVYPYSSASNKSILKDYVMDITVLKELVQNAEDAKATEVTFVWDWSDPLYIIYCRYIIHITYTYIYILRGDLVALVTRSSPSMSGRSPRRSSGPRDLHPRRPDYVAARVLNSNFSLLDLCALPAYRKLKFTQTSLSTSTRESSFKDTSGQSFREYAKEHFPSLFHSVMTSWTLG